MDRTWTERGRYVDGIHLRERGPNPVNSALDIIRGRDVDVARAER